MRESPVPVLSQLQSSNLLRFFPFVRRLGADEDPSSGVLIGDDLSTAVTASLEKGGRVLILGDQVRCDPQLPVTYFPPMCSAAGHIIKDHPALRGFPHEGFPDLQFYNLLEGASRFGVKTPEGVPYKESPIIGGLENDRGRNSKEPMDRYSFLFEVKVGPGKLLFSTLNIRPNLDEAYPEAVYLLDRLLRYTTSKEFDPVDIMPLEQYRILVVPYNHRVHSV